MLLSVQVIDALPWCLQTVADMAGWCSEGLLAYSPPPLLVTIVLLPPLCDEVLLSLHHLDAHSGLLADCPF
jgi:hypothetical protein